MTGRNALGGVHDSASATDPGVFVGVVTVAQTANKATSECGPLAPAPWAGLAQVPSFR